MSVKTIVGLAYASVKTVNGLAGISVKTKNGEQAISVGTVTGTITSSTTGIAVTSASVTIAALGAVSSDGSGFYSRSGVSLTPSQSISATRSLFNGYSSTVSPNTNPYTQNFTMVPIQTDVMPMSYLTWVLSGLGSSVTMGNDISVSRSIRITHYVVKNVSNGGGLTVSLRIYNSGGSLVSGSSVNSQTIPASTTLDVALSSPITLTAGTYRIAVYCHGSPIGQKDSGTPPTFSNHEAVTFTGNGYASSGDNYPTGQPTGNHYYPVSLKAEL